MRQTGRKKFKMPEAALGQLMAVGVLPAAVPPSHRAPPGTLGNVLGGRRTAPTGLGGAIQISGVAVGKGLT